MLSSIFIISDENMAVLKQIAPVTDYGEANVMPVYGGKLSLTGMLKMILNSRKK